nr:uncharacterized protein LOC113691619 isoform X2 [Coffea arabica]
MRIRKRFPPSASISSAAPSDPQLNRSPVVQPLIQVNPHQNLHMVQEEAKHNNPKNPDPQNQPFQQPNSQAITTTNENPTWDFLNSGVDEEKLKQKEIEGKEIKDERCSCNDTRKDSIQGELSTTQFPLPSSSSSPVIERWCEGDKVVPLKKRKGSFETINIASKETTKAKMKSKTNKKCLLQSGDGHEGIKNTMSSAGAKKSKRGSVIMEGSRCSRVNGRGWRCCQQTLVGYSLCEHHLGKGRLRSMTSVRNSAMTNQIGANEKDEITAPLSRLQEKEVVKSLSSKINSNDFDEQDDDEKKPLVGVKKRMKLGAVKARSMSSLLGQTDTNMVVGSNGNNHI